MSGILLNTQLMKIGAFLRGKRVMVTKPRASLTEKEMKSVKPNKLLDKKGLPKTFVRVRVSSLNDI